MLPSLTLQIQCISEEDILLFGLAGAADVVCQKRHHVHLPVELCHCARRLPVRILHVCPRTRVQQQLGRLFPPIPCNI